MSKLTASLVVDLVDKTGAKTQSIIGNMDRLKRAERDYMLANNGARLSNRDRAMERLMMEQEAVAEARRQRLMLLGARIGTGIAVGGVIAAKAYTNFAGLERRVNQIVTNADKGAEALNPTIQRLQGIANMARTSFDEVVGGLESLVSAGYSLDEALAFLPAVAITAQASGSAMNDVAGTADAMASSLKIGANEMQRAFDILVVGGKLGKFELKDMAQYLPTLAPAFAALGYKGTEGLSKLVAMLQTVRMQTGSSAEAATVLSNVFNKMESPETLNKFKKAGIDLQAELAKTRKEGGDVMDRFLDLVTRATKGDISKLGQLFADVDYLKGVRALITLRHETDRFNEAASKADNAAIKDFNKIVADSQGKVQTLSNLWDQFMTKVGSGVATVANPVLEDLIQTIDDATARSIAVKDLDPEQRAWQRADFDKEYRKLNPDAGRREINLAYGEALAKVGRGQSGTVFDDIRTEIGRRQGGAIAGRYPGRGSYGPGFVPEGLGAGPETDRIPYPSARPSGQSSGLDRTGRYPSRGTYDPAAVWEAQKPSSDFDGFMKFHGLVEAGNAASDKIAEGGSKAAETMQAGAAGVGAAIAQSFLAKVQGSLGALLTNSGGGRPTGQVVKEQANGQFVDP